MGGLERLIVDFVQMAEAPLYSTYRWLGRQLGRQIPLSEFLRLVNEAVQRDILSLWIVDAPSGNRTELFHVPTDLASRYASEPTLEDGYDPFGMSVSLGTKADADPEPDWEVNLDFEAGAFELELRRGEEGEVLEQLARCYPDVRASVTRREQRGEVRRITGTLTNVAPS